MLKKNMFVSRNKTGAQYPQCEEIMLKKIQVTFTLSPKILDDMKDLQTFLMMKSGKAWSFSQISELVLEEGIKNYRKQGESKAKLEEKILKA
ncbi:hypothetical protein C6988_07985 [Nitrosopumilus sp. b1]|nr:hypothetical protein C6988_07985 [Nitrosopumilus sp. b1]